VQLKKWQRNVIFNAVVAGKLNPSECEFDYDAPASRITHLPSGSYFLLEGDIRAYTATAVVGDEPPQPSRTFWVQLQERVTRWAEEVKSDWETPDLWAELQGDREILLGTWDENADNTPFTSDEQARIAEQLQHLKDLANTTHSLPETQLRAIDAKLDDAAAAAGRMGRKDWLNVFYGVMFTLIVTGLIPPETVQQMLTMALHGLRDLFGGGGTPPQIPHTT